MPDFFHKLQQDKRVFVLFGLLNDIIFIIFFRPLNDQNVTGEVVKILVPEPFQARNSDSFKQNLGLLSKGSENIVRSSAQLNENVQNLQTSSGPNRHSLIRFRNCLAFNQDSFNDEPNLINSSRRYATVPPAIGSSWTQSSSKVRSFSEGLKRKVRLSSVLERIKHIDLSKSRMKLKKGNFIFRELFVQQESVNRNLVATDIFSSIFFPRVV